MRITLFNIENHDSFLVEDLAQIKIKDDIEYFHFIKELYNRTILYDNSEETYETEIEDEIYKTAFIRPEPYNQFRESFIRDTPLFETRRLLIGWFLNRGRFDLVRNLTVPPGNFIFDMLGHFLYSSVSHLIIILAIFMAFFFSPMQKFQNIIYDFVLAIPFFTLIYSLRAKKDLGFNYLLRIELFSPKITLSLVSSMLLVFSSDEITTILSSSPHIKVAFFLVFGIFLTAFAWIYHFMRASVSPKLSIKRGIITSMRLFLTGLIINAWGYGIWFWQLTPSSDTTIKSLSFFHEHIFLPYIHFYLFPKFIILSTLVCAFIASFIHFVFEERRLH